jgi:hypothetical protein
MLRPFFLLLLLLAFIIFNVVLMSMSSSIFSTRSSRKAMRGRKVDLAPRGVLAADDHAVLRRPFPEPLQLHAFPSAPGAWTLGAEDGRRESLSAMGVGRKRKRSPLRSEDRSCRR